jgi:hypothetical protein
MVVLPTIQVAMMLAGDTDACEISTGKRAHHSPSGGAKIPGRIAKRIVTRRMGNSNGLGSSLGSISPLRKRK